MSRIAIRSLEIHQVAIQEMYQVVIQEIHQVTIQAQEIYQVAFHSLEMYQQTIRVMYQETILWHLQDALTLLIRTTRVLWKSKLEYASHIPIRKQLPSRRKISLSIIK